MTQKTSETLGTLKAVTFLFLAFTIVLLLGITLTTADKFRWTYPAILLWFWGISLLVKSYVVERKVRREALYIALTVFALGVVVQLLPLPRIW